MRGNQANEISLDIKLNPSSNPDPWWLWGGPLEIESVTWRHSEDRGPEETQGHRVWPRQKGEDWGQALRSTLRKLLPFANPVFRNIRLMRNVQGLFPAFSSKKERRDLEILREATFSRVSGPTANCLDKLESAYLSLYIVQSINVHKLTHIVDYSLILEWEHLKMFYMLSFCKPSHTQGST